MTFILLSTFFICKSYIIVFDFTQDNTIIMGILPARCDLEVDSALELIKEYDNFSSNLSIIAQTKSTPGLPIIAHKNANQTLFFDSIETAIDQLQPPTKKILHLKGIVKTRKSDYLSIKVNS